MEQTITAVEQVEVESREGGIEAEQLLKQLSDVQLAYVGGGFASFCLA